MNSIYFKISSLLICFLLLGISIPSITSEETFISSNSKVNHIFYVGGTGPGNYTHIQQAVDNASDNDTVHVYNGVYFGPVTIDKPLTVIGENWENTVIKSDGEEEMFQIRSNHVTVKNFYFYQNCTLLLGYLTNTKPSFSHCLIEHNMISSCMIAVFNHSQQNVITQNIFTDSNPSLGPGLYIVELGNKNSENHILKNTFSFNENGIS